MEEIEMVLNPVRELIPHRSGLAKHVRWLYLKICPQRDTELPLSWSELYKAAEAETPPVRSHSTVEDAVYKLADDLGIELPQPPRGRPRKFR